MSVPKIANAINFIDDELISEAESYATKRIHTSTAIKIAAISLAACLVLTFIFYPQPKSDFSIAYTSTTSANAEVIYAHEVYKHKVFGEYFPTEFPVNYYPQGKVYISGNQLEAAFYNHYNQDTISLIICPESLLPAGEIMGTVIYPENESSDISSYIWVDMGDYIAQYTSEKCDLSTLEGFDKMIESTN